MLAIYFFAFKYNQTVCKCVFKNSFSVQKMRLKHMKGVKNYFFGAFDHVALYHIFPRFVGGSGMYLLQ